MTVFVSRWAEWRDPKSGQLTSLKDDEEFPEQPDFSELGTAKTDKRPFGGFGGSMTSSGAALKDDDVLSEEPESSELGTAETDKRPFGGFGSSMSTGHGVNSGVTSEAGPIEAETVAGMSLDEFAKAGLIVTVNSGVLGRRVLFVSDNVPEANIGSPEIPVFRAAELKTLASMRPTHAMLRTLTEVKTVFRAEGATVEKCWNEE